MSEKIKITKNLNWDVTRTHEAISAFPEAALEQLAVAGLDRIVKDADLRAIATHAKSRMGAVGSEGEMFTLRGSDDIVMKVHKQPFSYVGVNAALHEGLAPHSQFSAPNYLGTIMSRNGTQATLMSRELGIELSQVNDRGRRQRERDVHALLQSTASNALASVGVDPKLAHWDWNHNNLLVPASVRDWRDVQNAPITILDQQASEIGDVDDWERQARPAHDPSQRDPRDAATEVAADEAWSRLMQSGQLIKH